MSGTDSRSRSRWHRELWKRASSPPLHPRLEITASTRLSPMKETENVSQAQGTVMSSSSTQSSGSSLVPLHNNSPAAETCTQPLSSFKKNFQSFNTLNWITNAAGSYIVFVTTVFLLILWAILGGVFGASQTWQIVMQDASSVQCYISDTLLMRQQKNGFTELLETIGELRSRNRSLVRMLRGLSPEQRQEVLGNGRKSFVLTKSRRKEIEEGSWLKKWFDIMCDGMAIAFGSLASLIGYATGVVVWIVLGKMLSFDNTWQLYMNTGVAVELTLTSIFLQHVRRRHALSLRQTLCSIEEVDCELEDRLRSITADTGLHQTVSIEPPERRFVERVIDGYAHLVGSGIGALLSFAVFSIWIGIGHILHWDSNWLLIIGSWTGLVGFIDAFVLRNVGFRQHCILDQQIQALEEQDLSLYFLLVIPAPVPDRSEIIQSEKRLSFRISKWFVINTAKWYVLVGALGVVALVLSVATALRWSETGQLIANTPTMIIEGFLLLVLIQAHNIAIVNRRSEFGACLARREVLNTFLQGSKHPERNEKPGMEVETKEL